MNALHVLKKADDLRNRLREGVLELLGLPVSKWHEWVGDATLADAILDRLVHHAYKITLKGPSRTKEKVEKPQL